VSVRPATDGDAALVAVLHASEIREGFLSSLGVRFLTRLYRRIVRSANSFLFVHDAGGRVLGFAAGTEDTASLYRSFLLTDGLAAGLTAAPQLARCWRQVLETLRYPSVANGLPSSELLAVAVDPSVRGRGVGRALVETAVTEFGSRGVPDARVVVAARNEAAIGLYRSCGFHSVGQIHVHHGTVSEVLSWP
jgi:ribosomal protein S18 acetylase RimI-like enzyme